MATKPEKTVPIIGFLAVFVLLITLAIVLYPKRSLNIRKTKALFGDLKDIYREKGMDGFLEAKGRLKDLVKDQVTQPNPPPEATNIAVFMFPDALPKENFEREEALDLWSPIQATIEKAPDPISQRKAFERMKANIFNYESPDKNNLNISPQALEVIRIYDTITKMKPTARK